MLMKFYHVFADGIDHFADTGTDAMYEFMRMLDVGYTRIRLYRVIGEDDTCIDYEEDCLLGIGEMPY
ncbi:hypothetical protein LCGC14_2503000 [marine sediment metagenome]|uniref:Uncharacterized protein n=1 Tax=marine sediment metagenome TaxID=412755 RepID=A0A0F9DV27_9ZZZZ